MNAAMKRSLSATCVFAMAVALSACAAGGGTEPVAMAPSTAPATDPERVFNKDIGELALAALEQMQSDDPGAGLILVNEALAQDVSEYERFMLLNLRADMNYRLNDYPGAIRDWQTMLTLDVAGPDERAFLRVNMGQLMILDDRVSEGVAVLEKWLETNQPKEAIVFLLASTLAADGQYDRALPYAEQAAQLADTVQRKHLDLLRYLYVRSGELAPPAL